MSKISFFQEDTDFSLSETDSLIQWIGKIIIKEESRLEALNFIFCSDEHLHKINVEYLNHDTYTDIITFDNSEDANSIEGDIFISVDRVKENSGNLKVDFIDELHRVIIHGVLHLIGYNDKTDEERKTMRKKEEACLSLRNNN